MPFLKTDGGHSAASAVKVEDMKLLVDTILENTATDDEKVGLFIILRYSKNITSLFLLDKNIVKVHCA